MTTTMHTYEFGTARNGYFNSSDGTITRDDGKTIRIRRDDGRMSVCVKEYSFGLKDDAPDEIKKMAGELPKRIHPYGGHEVSADEYLYDDVREGWWRNDAEWLVCEDEGAPEWATGVYSAGRSGGWCVIEGSEWLAENFYSSNEYTPDHASHGIDREDFDRAIEMRNEFCELAFSIVESIDGAHEWLHERIREEYAELEEARNNNTIRGEN